MKKLTGIAIFILVILPFLLAGVWDPSRVKFAIDCGASVQTKSTKGFTYNADQGFSDNSKISDYSVNHNIAQMPIIYSWDNFIYKTERHADESFTYEIPVPKPGRYVIIFQFCELYFQNSHQRKINIRFGDRLIVENLDIVEKAGGPFRAYDEYIEFELKSDEIYINNQKCPNAYKYKKKKLVIEFQKTSYDNPKVDGIILYEGTIADTDYDAIPEFRRQWELKIEEAEKAQQEERQKRLEERKKNMKFFEEDPIDMSDERTIFDGIRDVIFAREGAILGIVLLTFILSLLICVKEPPKLSENEIKKEHDIIKEKDKKTK